MSASAITTQDNKFNNLGLQKTTVNKEQVVCYSRTLGTASEQNPVLVLLHGYPQSSYIWRHLIPLLPSEAPIFAADLPGYGASAPIEDNDKHTIGSTVLAALQTEYRRTSSKSIEPLPVVLVGHDRGARVAHHLAAQAPAGFAVKGTCLIDIVPTTVQWESTAKNPKEIVGFFHWPLLANVDLAGRLITAFGREKWCEEMIRRWAGHNNTGLAYLEADGAMAVYGEFFSQDHTLDASNKDYEAGATVDVEIERGWRERGEKLDMPTLLVYSEQYIGKRFNVVEEWRDWVEEDKLTLCALGNGIGHFGAEEAPKETAKALKDWLVKL